MTRLLLPFHNGVEMDVLESLVRLASHQRATLIPLSLIPLPATKRKGVRLEHLQQSRDFLEAVRHKAARHQVLLEPVEVWTHDATQSILQSVEQLHCDGILLAARGVHGSLLRMDTIEQLIAAKPCLLFIVSFPPTQGEIWQARLRKRFTHQWPWSKCPGEPDTPEQVVLAPFPWDEREKREEQGEQQHTEKQESVGLALSNASLLDYRFRT